jgi:hypothetical protein
MSDAFVFGVDLDGVVADFYGGCGRLRPSGLASLTRYRSAFRGGWPNGALLSAGRYDALTNSRSCNENCF